MKHIWSVLCQRSSIDERSKLLSLFNCVEEIKLEINKRSIAEISMPISIPSEFQLVSFWTEEKKKRNSLDIKIDLLGPRGDILRTNQNKIDFPGESAKCRSIVDIKGLLIAGEGRYIIKVSQKTKKEYQVVAELPIDVNIVYKVDSSGKN